MALEHPADKSTGMSYQRGGPAVASKDRSVVERAAVTSRPASSDPSSTEPAASAPVAPRGRKYRGGFTTSICSLFSSSSHRRNDCCAVAFCGVLSSDRTKYLLTDEAPPSWWRRLLLNLVVPFILYMADQAVVRQILSIETTAKCRQAFPDDGSGPKLDVFNATLYPPGEDANYLQPEDTTRLANLRTAHVVVWPAFFITCIMLLSRAAAARFHFRNLIISRLFETDRTRGGGAGGTNTANLLLNRGDVRSATRTCGCYPAPDEQYDNATYALDEPTSDVDEPIAPKPDLCSCLWNFVSTLFCKCCCGCWCQCCGMCAIAQEEREMEMLVPKQQLLIDYVTFQPYAEYFPLLENLRQRRDGGFVSHWKSMSMLATQLMKTIGIVLLILTVYALADIDSNFTLINLVVVLATLLQSSILLYLVHWRWHRFDLSLDAVIKYFACGFLFSTSTAFVVEVLVSFVVSVCAAIIGIVALAFELGEMVINDDTDDEDVIPELIKKNIWLGVLFMAANAFLVAAATEELCKYFGFWMVVHPDLLTMEEEAAEGVEETFTIVSEAEGDGRVPSQERALNSKGVGITVGMVSTAVGFACCENLKYVFATSDIQTELGTLLARSIFPVHALAAAIQSIGLCRRDLEGSKFYQLGQIILPAVILHGCFDFFLMVSAVFTVYSHADDITTHNETAQEEAKYNVYLSICEHYNAVNDELWRPIDMEEKTSKTDMVITVIAFSLSVLSVIVGTIYYIVQSRAQKKRLDEVETARRQGSTLRLVR